MKPFLCMHVLISQLISRRQKWLIWEILLGWKRDFMHMHNCMRHLKYIGSLDLSEWISPHGSCLPFLSSTIWTELEALLSAICKGFCFFQTWLKVRSTRAFAANNPPEKITLAESVNFLKNPLLKHTSI